MAASKEDVGQDCTSGLGAPAWWIGLACAVLTVVVFLPTMANGLVNWDDLAQIRDNPHIRSLGWTSLKWMATTFTSGNWIPLTWLSHALAYQFWGLHPGLHHLANAALHAVSVFLVFLLAIEILAASRRAGPSEQPLAPNRDDLFAAATAACLFGLHPLRVESVAWLTERKDLLCAVFFLLSIREYLRYGTSSFRSYRRLGSCFGFFALALLSKPMAVTLPVVLLILDAWPLGRLKGPVARACKEKIPFFVLSVIIGLVAIEAQASVGAVGSLERVPVSFRVMNACHSLLFYVKQFVAPVSLVPFYPIETPGETAFSVGYILSTVVVVAVTAACLMLWRRGRPSLLAAWTYYLVVVGPVLGLLQVGGQAAADRYTYLPMLSLALVVGVGAARLRRLLGARVGSRLSLRLVSFLVAVWLLVLASVTVRQTKIWANSYTLWKYVTDVYPNHPFPLDGLGAALLERGDVDQAIVHLERALELAPRYVRSYRELWYAYNRKEMHNRALETISKAIELEPKSAEAHNCLGITYAQMDRHEESGKALRKAVSLAPGNPEYLANLGVTCKALGKMDEAVSSLRRACKLSPNTQHFVYNLGKLYLGEGKTDLAIEALREAVRLDPGKPWVCLKLGEAYETVGKLDLAMSSASKVLELAPGFAPAHIVLARVYQRMGKPREAKAHYTKAKELGLRDEALERQIFGEGGADSGGE